MHHAYHEAGHAVVAWHFRLPIRSVSIAPIGSTGGRVRYAPSLKNRDRRLQLTAIEAGQVAVACLCRRLGWDQALADKGTADDVDQAFDLAAAIVGTHRHRAPGQTEEQWIQQGGLPALHELVKASGQAREVLESPRYWHAVDQLAAALLKQSTLTGEQASLLIEAALREGQQKARAAS